MKTSCKNHHTKKTAIARGFTLIELLVVIAIIAILAGLLMPALAKVKVRGQITTARGDIQGIITGVNQYFADYSRYPTSKNAADAASANSPNLPDFTYGTRYPGASVRTRDGLVQDEIVNNNGTGYQFSNAEVMSILLNREQYTEAPYGSIMDTPNVNSQRNPKKNVYLTVKESGTIGAPGLGPDLVLRDPWGNPYMISLDMNYDDKTRDAFYSRASVSQESGDKGYYGLVSTNGTYFDLHAPVMAWSMGPDGRADSGTKANAGVNEDNVLSWK